MLEFIKMFGLGILYTILFPFIVAIFTIYLIYVFLNYLFFEVISFFGFLFGYTFTDKTALEKQLGDIKEKNNHSIEKNNVGENVVYKYNSEGVIIQEEFVEDEKGSDE